LIAVPLCLGVFWLHYCIITIIYVSILVDHRALGNRGLVLAPFVYVRRHLHDGRLFCHFTPRLTLAAHASGGFYNNLFAARHTLLPI
jgi:hypothetical protein